MGVCFQGKSAHLANQLAETDIFVKISAENQSIDEEADQILHLDQGTAGGRRTNENAVLHRVAP